MVHAIARRIDHPGNVWLAQRFGRLREEGVEVDAEEVIKIEKRQLGKHLGRIGDANHVKPQRL